MRCLEIIDGMYGCKTTIVQLVLTKDNPVDKVRNYDKMGTLLYSSRTSNGGVGII